MNFSLPETVMKVFYSPSGLFQLGIVNNNNNSLLPQLQNNVYKITRLAKAFPT